MSDVLKACIRALCVLSLSLTACTPVEEQKPASISGRVYFDVDQSSSCEKNETGIEGMSIRLYAGACGESMLQTHYTDENGEFIFPGLAPGEYCVIPDFEFKTCGWDGNLPTTAISRKVTLESGMKADLVWFGFGTLSNSPES
jgi:hypothetical protein